MLGDGGPLQVPPNSVVSIGADGTVSAKGADGKNTAIGKLKLVTPEAPLTRGEDGLFRAADGDLSADDTARVQDGALEGSNVSAVEAMVAMISAARQFEAQMKMISTAEANEKSAAQLLTTRARRSAPAPHLWWGGGRRALMRRPGRMAPNRCQPKNLG